VYTPKVARSAKGPWSSGDQNPVCMVDSGATANFVSVSFLKSLAGENHVTPDLVLHQVKLANGSVIPRLGTVTLYLKFQYHVMPVLCSLIALKEYDIILGMPWLAKEKPAIDWESGTMHVGWADFEGNREEVLFPLFKGVEQQGVWHLSIDFDDTPEDPPAKPGRDEPRSWWGVDERPLAANPGSNTDVNLDFNAAIAHLPQSAQDLLREFSDRFDETELQKLPPHRDIDHNVQLQPGSRPSFMQPYRMSQAELDMLRSILEQS
jgi:Retroviral aspartyl protease